MQCKPFEEYKNLFNEKKCKSYFRQLLEVLNFAHSKGIIHRDIKPPNILFDFETEKLKLIDWGLSEIYKPNFALSSKVSSRYFKSPELLMDSEFYNYSIDIWSVGVIFASIVF